MALDSKQKRMSALNFSFPSRGPLVDATESGFNTGNRSATVFMYSGISAAILEARRELHDRGNLRGIGTGVLVGQF